MVRWDDRSLFLMELEFLIRFDKVATQGLLSLNGLEQGLEVASSEALVVPSLNDFEEKSRAVLQWLGKDL